ncbi:MAG: F0F1 ATP synthase subunit B [Pseudomonadota bacterium]
MLDATWWTFIGLLLFFGLIIYLKVPGIVGKALDDRSDKIANQLDEARRLREEAQELLAQYTKKRAEAEQEAEDIVDAAKREADAYASEAKKKTEDYIARRTAMAEQKIAQAEADAVNEVRSSAVDTAVAAAEQLLGSKLTAAKSNDLFKTSLGEIKERLN